MRRSPKGIGPTWDNNCKLPHFYWSVSRSAADSTTNENDAIHAYIVLRRTVLNLRVTDARRAAVRPASPARTRPRADVHGGDPSVRCPLPLDVPRRPLAAGRRGRHAEVYRRRTHVQRRRRMERTADRLPRYRGPVSWSPCALLTDIYRPKLYRLMVTFFFKLYVYVCYYRKCGRYVRYVKAFL